MALTALPSNNRTDPVNALPGNISSLVRPEFCGVAVSPESRAREIWSALSIGPHHSRSRTQIPSGCTMILLLCPQKLTPEVMAAAIEGFQEQKNRIDAQIAELRQMLGGSSDDKGAGPPLPRNKRRTRSAAVRARTAAAQRKRWAANARRARERKPRRHRHVRNEN
jgi:hypothetical protein